MTEVVFQISEGSMNSSKMKLAALTIHIENKILPHPIHGLTKTTPLVFYSELYSFDSLNLLTFHSTDFCYLMLLRKSLRPA